MDNDDLLNRARKGDREAWNLLLQRIRPMVQAYLLRRINQDSDASDLANVTLLRADQGFANFRGDTYRQLEVWIRKIAAHAFIDRMRQPRPPLVSLVGDFPQPEASTPAWQENWERVLVALPRLKKRRRAVLEARFLSGLPCAEVARRMGQSEVWVRVTCMRAIKDLRRLLQRGES